MKKSILIFALAILFLSSNTLAKDNVYAAGMYFGGDITRLKGLEYPVIYDNFYPEFDVLDVASTFVWGFEFESVFYKTKSMTHGLLVRLTFSNTKASATHSDNNYDDLNIPDKYIDLELTILDESGNVIDKDVNTLIEHNIDAGFKSMDFDVIYKFTPFKTRNLSFMLGGYFTDITETSMHQTMKLKKPQNGYFKYRTPNGRLIYLHDGLNWTDEYRGISAKYPSPSHNNDPQFGITCGLQYEFLFFNQISIVPELTYKHCLTVFGNRGLENTNSFNFGCGIRYSFLNFPKLF